MEYGYIELKINQLLKEKNISKNKICKDLYLPKPNFNRYCNNQFQRIDTNLIAQLCWYFECDIDELIIYKRDS